MHSTPTLLRRIKIGPTFWMQSLHPEYLDPHDLAAMLDITPATIRRRLRVRPWTLPGPVYLGPNYPLRWRRTDVALWQQENAEPLD